MFDGEVAPGNQAGRWCCKLGAACLGLSSLPFLAGASGASLRQYDEMVAKARQCVAQEPCAIAGGVMGCRCEVAVRADMKALVDARSRAVRCGQVERQYCPPLLNPQCEKKQCVAVQAPE